MYGFSEFTASLNELEEGMAPTDSRLRPDQRIMEEQDFDRANSEKVYITVWDKFWNETEQVALCADIMMLCPTCCINTQTRDNLCM